MDIIVNTGLQKFNLGGKVVIEFNPSDVAFAEKIYRVFEELDRKQQEYKERLNTLEDEQLFEFGREIDGEMRTAINNLFGIDVMTPLIGDMNAYALADGLPVWANIILAVLDTMEVQISEEQKKSQAKINKYTKKYHK